MDIQASCEVDLNGLAPGDRKRIREIGFDAWVDEIEAHHNPTRPLLPDSVLAIEQAKMQQRQAKKARACVCGKPFLAKRADAKFCSQSCRRRATRP